MLMLFESCTWEFLFPLRRQSNYQRFTIIWHSEIDTFGCQCAAKLKKWPTFYEMNVPHVDSDVLGKKFVLSSTTKESLSRRPTSLLSVDVGCWGRWWVLSKGGGGLCPQMKEGLDP